MKKKLICMIIGCSLVMGMFIGCSGYSDVDEVFYTKSDELQPTFVEVERETKWRIVYDKETKVMYAVSKYGTGAGNFTLLVDETGKPKLYQGE